MSQPLPLDALERVFLSARTAYAFVDRAVDDATLARLHELYKWGPTSMNCQPARVVFVRSRRAKERLVPAMSPGNRDKTMTAPVTAIVAYDTRFYENLPIQFAVNPAARDIFANNEPLAQDTAMRNSALQGAYLIVAARMLGLDAGPMSGFDANAVNAAFFPDGQCKVNFMVNLGWAEPAGLRPRGPRLSFEASATIV